MLHIFILFILYLFPAAVLFHFAVETFFRNPGQTDYQLASLILVAIMLMFCEEFVRQLLPVSSSVWLIPYAFGNFGALSASLIIHFYFRITRNIFAIRPVFYIPLSYAFIVPSLLTLLLKHNIYNSSQFYRYHLWIQPVYNGPYYIAILIGITVVFGLSAMIHVAAKRTSNPIERKRLKMLLYGALAVGVWHVIFGIFPGWVHAFRNLPPYPYIFGDLVWLTILRWTMNTQELLPPYGKQYKALFNLVPVAIVVADEKHRIVEANPTAIKLFGTTRARLKEFLPKSTENRDELIALFRTRRSIHDYETKLEKEDGTLIPTLLNSDFVEVNGKPLSISIIQDITARKNAEARISHLAYYDSLTNLPNRAYFYELLEASLFASGRSPRFLAVILVDIDHFKQINDAFGHQAGDHAIQHVASILNSILRTGDTAGRLGGDEFVLMLLHFSSHQEVLGAADRISDSLRSEVAFEDITVPISASIGVAIFPEHGRTPDELIKSADTAMYQAKQAGRDRFVIFAHTHSSNPDAP